MTLLVTTIANIKLFNRKLPQKYMRSFTIQQNEWTDGFSSRLPGCSVGTRSLGSVWIFLHPLFNS